MEFCSAFISLDFYICIQFHRQGVFLGIFTEVLHMSLCNRVEKREGTWGTCFLLFWFFFNIFCRGYNSPDDDHPDDGGPHIPAKCQLLHQGHRCLLGNLLYLHLWSTAGIRLRPLLHDAAPDGEGFTQGEGAACILMWEQSEYAS